MHLILFLSLITCVAGGMGIGWVAKTRQSIDYKRRWQEALALLQQEKQATGQLASLDTPGNVATLTSKTEKGYTTAELEALRKKLRSLPFDSDRESMEFERLRNGLPPVDDLKSLNFASTYKNMVKTRIKYGWDELGKPIR